MLRPLVTIDTRSGYAMLALLLMPLYAIFAMLRYAAADSTPTGHA